MRLDYRQKYLKYKMKYLGLKNEYIQTGKGYLGNQEDYYVLFTDEITLGKIVYKDDTEDNDYLIQDIKKISKITNSYIYNLENKNLYSTYNYYTRFLFFTDNDAIQPEIESIQKNIKISLDNDDIKNNLKTINNHNKCITYAILFNYFLYGKNDIKIIYKINNTDGNIIELFNDGYPINKTIIDTDDNSKKKNPSLSKDIAFSIAFA